MEIRIGRVLIAGISAFVLAIATVFLIVTGYAVKLGFEARGQPDQELIQAFAERVAPWVGPIASGLLTLIAGYWAAASAGTRRVLHGVLVGGVVGALSLAMSIATNFSATDLLWALISVAIGWLAGTAAERRGGPSRARLPATGP